MTPPGSGAEALSEETCPLCHRQGRSGVFLPFETRIADFEYGVKRDAIYSRCNQCHLVAQRPAVPAAQVPDLYPDDYQAFSRPKKSLFAIAKKWIVRKDARAIIAAAQSSTPTVLEIGCGNGTTLETVKEVCPAATVVGIDIKDLGLSQHPYIEFHEGQLHEVSLSEGRFDVVYFSNLIEHVIDPIAFLEQVHHLLRPGGSAIIITPNFRSLDRYVFGRYWGGYHFPRHLYLFDDRTIREAVDVAGLECQSVTGSYAWWFISIANLLFENSARRGRGIEFAVVSALFLPFDLAVNAFRRHGSMRVVARRPERE